ncbi:MAG: AMP-binding protein [Dehalococcoidales bacterium]|nr:AMP-binding protein [Dehalococcoidales bacterium]
MNLQSVLENTASRYGDRNAIVYGEYTFSYSFINRESNRFAHALINAGIRVGDKVALFLSNSPEFVISFFGTLKAGAVVVPLEQQYKLPEVKSILDQCLPSVIVSEPVILKLMDPVIQEFGYINRIIEVSPEPSGKYPTFEDFLDTGSVEPTGIEPSAGDTAALMYTSSPSYHPLGVILSHNSFVQEAIASAEGYNQTEQDIMMLFSLPMFHVFGLASAALGSIYAGSAIVIVPGTGLSLNSFMAAVEREKGTMYLGVPYIYALAVDMAEKGEIQYNLNSLRVCASAGAPLPVKTAERFLDLYGKQIIDCYGLTEAVSHVTTANPGGVIKAGSIGKPLPVWDIRIVDSTGTELPAGQSGELIVIGPIMTGYYNEPEATAKTIKNGWLHTGDVAYKDEDGYLFITGRCKDTIIVKGQNIYPVDPEHAILAHPAVKEVAVMGIPDEMRGEVVMAAIHLHEGYTVTEHEIRQACQERVAGYKAPRKIFFTDAFPKTGSGEIDREALRQKLSLPPVFPVR